MNEVVRPRGSEGNAAFTCPACGSNQIRAIDSRAYGDGTRRRRYRCVACSERFSTVERIVDGHLPQGGIPEAKILEGISSLELLTEIARRLKSYPSPTQRK